MNYKSIFLTLIAIAAIVLVCNFPAYSEWVQNKISTVVNINNLAQHLNVEERKEARYGYSYTVFRDIKENIAKEKDAVILLPPDDYLQDMKITYLNMVEPSVFYYFTGVKGVNVTSPQVRSANWALVAQGYGRITLQKINTREQLDSQLVLYRKYQH